MAAISICQLEEDTAPLTTRLTVVEAEQEVVGGNNEQKPDIAMFLLFCPMDEALVLSNTASMLEVFTTSGGSPATMTDKTV